MQGLLQEINENYIEKVIMKTTTINIRHLKYRILYILKEKEKLIYPHLMDLIQNTKLGHSHNREWIHYSDYQIRHQLDKFKKQKLIRTINCAIDSDLIDARKCFYALSPLGTIVFKYLCSLNKQRELK